MSTSIFDITGTVISEPKMIEEQCTFYMESCRPTVLDGVATFATMLVFVRFSGKKAEDMAKKITIDSRVAVSGTIIGDSKGNPFIISDPQGESFTRFDVKASALRWMGTITRNADGSMVGGQVEDLVTLMIIGFLGKDIELRYAKNGTPYATTSIATSSGKKDDQGKWINDTVWWRVVAWDKTAEGMSANGPDGEPMLKKGSAVFVTGSPTHNEDGGPNMFQRTDGTKGASYEMTLFRWGFVGRRSDTAASFAGPKEESPDEDI